MPIYEYRRADGSTFDVMQSIFDDAFTEDPQSGVPVTRVLHAPAIHFKGSGFYNTDYGKQKANRQKAESESANSGSGSDSDSSSSDSSSSDSSSSDSGSSDSGSSIGQVHLGGLELLIGEVRLEVVLGRRGQDAGQVRRLTAAHRPFSNRFTEARFSSSETTRLRRARSPGTTA
ncbi:MAG: hypothetical protein WKF40_04100 [Thermoleophilaceae bacterium]